MIEIEVEMLPKRRKGRKLWCKLPILSRQWHVYLVPADDPDIDDGEGACMYEPGVILVSNHLDAKRRDSTLVHEWLHALCYQMDLFQGRSRDEERVVATLAPVLWESGVASRWLRIPKAPR